MKFIKLILAIAVILFLMGCSKPVTTPPEVLASSNMPPNRASAHIWAHGVGTQQKEVRGHWVESPKGVKYFERQRR